MASADFHGKSDGVEAKRGPEGPRSQDLRARLYVVF
jgi:hypothetical protein